MAKGEVLSQRQVHGCPDESTGEGRAERSANEQPLFFLSPLSIAPYYGFRCSGALRLEPVGFQNFFFSSFHQQAQQPRFCFLAPTEPLALPFQVVGRKVLRSLRVTSLGMVRPFARSSQQRANHWRECHTIALCRLALPPFPRAPGYPNPTKTRALPQCPTKAATSKCPTRLPLSHSRTWIMTNSASTRSNTGPIPTQPVPTRILSPNG